jgi:dTDP-4-amino-4,6-dideoxygalactose transaminase
VIDGDRALVADRLVAAGIGVGRHYPFVCPDQPAARGRGKSLDSLLIARRIAAGELSLPIHPFLTDSEVEQVLDACQDVAR